MTPEELAHHFRILPEVLEAQGVRHCTDAEVRELLGAHGRRDQNLAGLDFPYRDPRDGHIVGHRVRRDHPEIGSDGKPIDKYLSDKGNRHFFFPPIPAEWLGDTSIPVVFVESEKSALAIHAVTLRTRNKMIPIAIGGCWGWKRTSGKKELPDGGSERTSGPGPDFNLLAWTKRQAIVLSDSNVATSLDVQWARGSLSNYLLTMGAQVFHSAVPVIPGVNGPDDFIAMSTDEEVVGRMLNKIERFDATPKENKPKVSQTTQLVDTALSAGLELFHDRGGTTYVSTSRLMGTRKRGYCNRAGSLIT